MCAIVLAPIPLLDSMAGRLQRVGLYGKKDMCALEVSPEVLSEVSP